MIDKITILNSLYNVSCVSSSSLNNLYDLILEDKSRIRDITYDISRNSGKPDIQNKLKKTLPIVIVNGLFNKRDNKCLVEYSSFICIDLDYDLPEEETIRDTDWDNFIANPLTRLAYHSPKGGIKVIIEHDSTDPANHKELYVALSDLLGNPHIDKSCHDLARCHFITYDPGAFYNPASSVYHFTPSSISSEVHIRKTFSGTEFGKMKSLLVPTIPKFSSTKAAIKKAQEIADKHFPVVKGYRNSHTYKLACLFKDYGVSQDDALMYLVLRYVEADFLGSEIENIVKSEIGRASCRERVYDLV